MGLGDKCDIATAISKMLNTENCDTGSAEKLMELGQSYLGKHEFHLGQLVTWKPGMKNSIWPKEGKPAVVIGLNPGGTDPREDTGSPHFNAPRGIRIGLLSIDGAFEGYWTDENRLQPYNDDAAPEPVYTTLQSV